MSDADRDVLASILAVDWSVDPRHVPFRCEQRALARRRIRSESEIRERGDVLCKCGYVLATGHATRRRKRKVACPACHRRWEI